MTCRRLNVLIVLLFVLEVRLPKDHLVITEHWSPYKQQFFNCDDRWFQLRTVWGRGGRRGRGKGEGGRLEGSGISEPVRLNGSNVYENAADERFRLANSL